MPYSSSGRFFASLAASISSSTFISTVLVLFGRARSRLLTASSCSSRASLGSTALITGAARTHLAILCPQEVANAYEPTAPLPQFAYRGCKPALKARPDDVKLIDMAGTPFDRALL